MLDSALKIHYTDDHAKSGESFGDMTRSLVSVSIDGRSKKCPTDKNPTFDPEMLKLRQNVDISLFQGTVSATKK